MKNHYSLSLASIIILVGFIACKKHHHDSDPSISISSLTSTYRLASVTTSEIGSSVVNNISLDNCVLDNEIELNPNLTLTFLDANSVCNPRSDDSGTWNLSGDSLMLSKSFGVYVTGGKITSFVAASASNPISVLIISNTVGNNTTTATWVTKY